MNNEQSWLKMKKKTDVVEVIENKLILYLQVLVKLIAIKAH
jgi:hypothetical protein